MRNAEALADGRERQPFDIPEMDNHCAALFPIFHEILELCIRHYREVITLNERKGAI
jgi:hypothetical protein